MTDLRKAAEMAIDAMISDDVHKRAVAIVELRQALAKPDEVNQMLVESIESLMEAQYAYEMEVANEGDVSYAHKEMMRKAKKALAKAKEQA